MNYKILDKSILLKEKFVEIERVELEVDSYDDRKIKMERFALIRPEVGAILLYNKNKHTVILVEQFRYSSLRTENGWVKEIVAGLLEEGEDRMECVRREAMEEAGYLVKDIEHFNTFYPGWGFSDQIMYLYYAEVDESDQVAKGGGLFDETEDIKVIEQDFDEVMEEVRMGKIKDSKTIIALQWLALNLRKLNKSVS